MKTLLSSILLAFLVLSISGFKIENNEMFVQFYVPAMENREKAIELSEYLKSKDGVKLCRVDASGKTVYIVFKIGFNYTESDIKSWLDEKNVTYTCFHSGTFGKDSFKQLTPADCGK